MPGTTAPDARPTRPNRDLLMALGVFVLLVLWGHRGMLGGGKVNSFSAGLPAFQTIRSIYEMVYQEPPVQWTTARMLKDGVFPAWTPFPEGGTPLLGKMQNGIFSPFHLHLYLLPDRWMPYAFTFIPILTGLCLYSLAYLLGRLLTLSLPGAILAASCFTFFGPNFIGHALFADSAAAAALPLLLLLFELHLRGCRSWSRLLLPWAVALPFLVGHFESAVRIILMSGLYLVWRLRRQEGMTPAQKLDHLGALAVSGAVGGLLAFCQILPGMEYADWSYNMVWRTRPEYGWMYSTIQKRFAAADLPMLLLGWAASAAGVWSLQRATKASLKGLWPWLAGAAVALAVGIAALYSVGLDDTGVLALKPSGDPGLWFGAFFLLVFAFWELGQDLPPAQQALGVLLVLGAAIQIKIPPLSNLINKLPVIGLFNNTSYTPEFDLCRCLLAACAVERCWSLARRPWPEKTASAYRALAVLLALALAWAGAQTLKSRLPASGTNPWMASPGGGFLGPERPNFFGRLYHVDGWLDPDAAPASVSVSDIDGDRVRRRVDASLTAGEDGRRYFHADVPIEDRGNHLLVAQALLANGKTVQFRGPQVSALSSPSPLTTAVSLAALPLALLNPWIGAAAYAALDLLHAHRQTVPVVPAEQFPFQLPGMEKLRQDLSLFRVDSFSPSFLSADYPNLYGLQDIRNGGDNLDMLPMIYLLFLSHNLINQPDGHPDQIIGLKLLGLANVKYLFDYPESQRRSPGLEEHYRGPDMVIYRNRYWRPRAAFFSSSALLPAGDLRDWDAGRRLAFGRLNGFMHQPDFRFEDTLILNDTPAPPPAAPAPASAKEPTVQVDGYTPARVSIAVDTPRPGFVFLADNLFPGWKAFLNGERTDILRSWLTFRAVAVPAGRSRLEFRYEPLRLAAALGVSWLTCLGWLGFYLRHRWKRIDFMDQAPAAAPRSGNKRKKPAAPAPDPTVARWTAAAVESVILMLVLPCLLYWGAWSVFIGHGSTAAKTGGLLLLLLSAAAVAAALRPRPAPPAACPEGVK